MKNKEEVGLDFIVDKLTNSIENVVSGDRFQTEISMLDSKDLKTILKKNGWVFNWKIELKDTTREVYKLTIAGNPTIVQGLLSTKVSEQIKRHFYLDILKIQNECALIFQCYFHFRPACSGIFPSQHPVQRIFPEIVIP